jgi:putative solute:sodium symporter small subunit
MSDSPPHDAKPRHSQTRLPAGGLSPEAQAAYWARNIRILVSLLLIWFTVSFGFGILLRNWLDQWQLPGTHFPLGFWFAQQGSIISFVVLVFVYAWRMNKLDEEFGVGEGKD